MQMTRRSRIFAITLVQLALAALAATHSPATAQMPADYCRFATRTIVMLVDRTSPIDQRDREALEASIPSIDQYLDGRTLFSLQTIGEGVTEGRTVLEKCVPGCPPSGARDVFLGSSCIPARADADRAAFKREFYGKLRALAESPEAAGRSDIAGRLAEVSRTFNQPGRPLTHVVIFSDMIDNVLVPHRVIYSQPHERTMQIARQREIIGNFTKTSIAVFGFGRSDIPPRGSLPPAQVQTLRSFWLDWFKAGGAENVSLGFRLQPPER
jgi:hypothetical protein